MANSLRLVEQDWTWLFAPADGEAVQHVIKFDEPTSYTFDYRGSEGVAELGIVDSSIATKGLDGNGSYDNFKISPTIQTTDFGGGSDGQTNEMAYDSSNGRLFFLGGDGNNYYTQADLNRAKDPTIDNLEDTGGGVRIHASGQTTTWLSQTAEFYVSVDSNKPSVPPPGTNWNLITTQPDFQKNVTHTNISDGEERYYALRNVIVKVNGQEVYGHSDTVGHTYNEPVNQPTNSPINLTLSNETSDGTKDLEGGWQDDDQEVIDSVYIELYESTDSGSTWSRVWTGSQPYSDQNITHFGGYQATFEDDYRFRAQYQNSAGSGPWSSYSDVLTYKGD